VLELRAYPVHYPYPENKITRKKTKENKHISSNRGIFLSIGITMMGVCKGRKHDIA